MRPDLRSLSLDGAIVLVGAAFCAFAALDLYITRGAGSPSLAANKAARTALRAQFWGLPQRDAGGQQLPAADRLAYYQMMILHGGPVDVAAADELPVQQTFARRVQTPEFSELPRAARKQVLDWASEDLPNDEGNHVYSIPALKIPSLEARASRGDCGAAQRLASYSVFGSLGAYDKELKWMRVAAQCPGSQFNEWLARQQAEQVMGH
ncbi:hypothetical protein [Pseudoduganella violaceinigra]|uniref:hypothetical protein n=1 Tax=Pseudoduganella violaceinigra TaxID=246602 RepID=UPI0003FE69E5|nr:hypothetical protein [Pseudoduganella violaceinigra]